MWNMILTVISGVLVFILGQLFIEYFLKPIQEYKKLRAKIAFSLTYYANLYGNPVKHEKGKVDNYEIGSDKIRILSAEVSSFVEIRPVVNFFIPQKDCLAEVAKDLMGLSNSFFFTSDRFRTIEHNHSYVNDIYRRLGIKVKQ